MPSRSRWLALVALDEPVPADPERFLADYTHTLAGVAEEAAPPVVTSRTALASTYAWPGADAGNLTGATLNLTLIDKPIPWSQLEGPCATAWYWPEAARTLRNHKSHLFVTLLDENPKALGQAMRMTRIVAALAKSCPAVGLLWGASGAVHEPNAFAELAATASPEHLPLNLWIDFRVYEHEPETRSLAGREAGPNSEGDPGFGMFTTGLDALGRLEFETPRFHGDPQRLVSAVYNVAHYVLEKQAVLRDGEVIGLPSGDEVTIREERSTIDPEQDVLRLDFS